MMPATETVVRRRVPRRCTRCGIGDRWVDLDGVETYICCECRVQGTYLTERAEAEQLFPDYRTQRVWLMAARSWRGGW